MTRIHQDDASDNEVFSNHGVVDVSQNSFPKTVIDTPCDDLAELETPNIETTSRGCKRELPFPVFASCHKKLCVVKPPQKMNDCQMANSTPSNMVKSHEISGSNGCESAFVWNPNPNFTPHVLHEITHADGIKHDVLLPDTWITGTLFRGFPSMECQPDCLKITDFFGSWTASIANTKPLTARHAMQQALPRASIDWVQEIFLNGKKCEWDTLCVGGTLMIKPYKFKRILFVPELMKAINLYCDVFDTPEQINSEHPLLRGIGPNIDWIHTDMTLFRAVRIEPNNLVLDFPYHCWTLHSVDWVPSRPHPLRIMSDLTTKDPVVSLIGRVMCIHPFTGKSAEFPLSTVTCVCDLFDVLSPPIPAGIDIVAEINGKRIDLTTLLSDLDLSRVIRFKHYGLVGGAPALSRVRTELMAHGVPEDQVSSRAKAVITALGEPRVQDIFQQNDPWAAMKSSCKDKQLRLVLPTELKQHQKVMRSASSNRSNSTSASSTANDGNPKGIGKGGKAKGKGKTKGKVVFDFDKDFDRIVFPIDGFSAPNGDKVTWISKSQITRDSTGLCALPMSEAQPFVHLRSFSVDPLALLVVGHDVELDGSVQQIAVPITLKPDHVPYLIPCSLVQLGDESVQYEFNGPSTTVTTTPSCVLEIAIDKQRCKMWCEIYKPLDLLVQCVPVLRDTQKILSHWSWIWTDEGGKVCPVASSCRLHGYLRVPDDAAREILQQSGPNGLGVWPKTEDKKPDPKFAHIPIESSDCEKVQALVQTIPEAIGFVCVNNKFKIRCLREDYAALRKHLVPQGVIFDASTIQQDDLLFVLSSPAALSVSMSTLTDGIQQIGWDGVVVRPMGPSSWLVKATREAPGPHLAVNEHILSVRSFVPDKPRASITHFASSKVQQNGELSPWANYKPTTAGNDAPAVGATMQRINDVEKELSSKIEEQMKQMMDTRIQTLEKNVGNQIQALETKSNLFQEACSRRFTEVEATVNSSIQGLQNKIDTQGTTIITQMKELFKTYNTEKNPNDETPKRPRRGDKSDENDPML